MIECIRVTGLKSIRDLTVTCTNLNLFVGTNSSGKSTFLQGLLLMAQEQLNGKYVTEGDFREARNYNMPGSPIRIEVLDVGKKEPSWIQFDESKDGKDATISKSLDEIDVEALLDDKDYEAENDDISDFIFQDIDFHYLSCHRIGARDIYEKNMIIEDDFGVDGEHALAYLLANQEKKLDDSIVIVKEGFTNTLLDQVNYWMNYIVGTALNISDIKKTNYLQVRYNNNPANYNSEALYSRPTNVGSGVSYLISIIIACLGAENGSELIIENPEIHLHPKAQSRLCDFLYHVSCCGRQLFVETHSDHIFNGIRAGIAAKEMDPRKVGVNFFALDNNYETCCNPIRIQEYGKIAGTNDSMTLDDLFDQFEIDLDKMLGI